MPQRPNHVIVQEGFARYLYFIFTVAIAVICPKPNNTRPYSEITTVNSALAICYEYFTRREKANLDSQEVHGRTHFVSVICIP